MSGETALDRLLSHMSPTLHATPYVIVSDAEPSQSLRDAAFMVCEEAEGTTLILEASAAGTHAQAPHYARITLSIHSSLEAVGLTAAVSAALQQRDIPANVVAGFYHDHLFVPWHQRTVALDALLALSAQSAGSTSS